MVNRKTFTVNSVIPMEEDTRHFTNKNIFQLGMGQFSPCSLKWNDKTNSFEKNTLEEVYDCCQNKCNEFLKKCKNKHVCKTDECISCDTIQDICSKNCLLPLQTDEYKHIIDCIYNFCNPNDVNCIKTYKEDLLKCCNSRCTDTSLLNCDKYCELLINSLLELAIENENHHLKPININKIDKSNIFLRVVLFILLGLIGIFVIKKIIYIIIYYLKLK